MDGLALLARQGRKCAVHNSPFLVAHGFLKSRSILAFLTVHQCERACGTGTKVKTPQFQSQPGSDIIHIDIGVRAPAAPHGELAESDKEDASSFGWGMVCEW
jgi:hypothetical protein